MSFVIVGYGRVGTRTVRILHEEGHAVTVVETDVDKITRAREAGHQVIAGDGTDQAVLQDAGLDSALAVAGLTGNPICNYQVCQHASEAGCRTVMRISEDVPEDQYNKYSSNVDELVYPEQLGAAGAKTALLGGSFNALSELTAGLRQISLTIPEDAPIIDKTVNEIDFGSTARVYAHGPAGESMTIPRPGQQIASGDRVALVVEQESVESAKQALLGE